MADIIVVRLKVIHGMYQNYGCGFPVLDDTRIFARDGGAGEVTRNTFTRREPWGPVSGGLGWAAARGA